MAEITDTALQAGLKEQARPIADKLEAVQREITGIYAQILNLTNHGDALPAPPAVGDTFESDPDRLPVSWAELEVLRDLSRALVNVYTGADQHAPSKPTGAEVAGALANIAVRHNVSFI